MSLLAKERPQSVILSRMDSDLPTSASLTLVDDVLWVVWQRIDFPRYDFEFERFFPCRHPWQRPERVVAVARLGATDDYRVRYAQMQSAGIDLINTPEEYNRASEITGWYPLIQDLTPRSLWFETRPTFDQITAQFTLPVFLKGIRQTSRHQRHLSIIHNVEEFDRAIAEWNVDPILRWQPVVCREFMRLRLVGEQSATAMPRAFEFRSFWWHGRCAGIGPYWMDMTYMPSTEERSAALDVAGEAARRVNVPFLVVDVAQVADGRWIVIECNDGQDSGYAGVNPMLMWRQIIEIQREQIR